MSEDGLKTLAWRDNQLLSALRQPDLDYMIPYLKTFLCRENHILYSPGDDVETVYARACTLRGGSKPIPGS